MWNDLTLKERKDQYKMIKKNNPNLSYFNIKKNYNLSQNIEIPSYQDGGKTKSNSFEDAVKNIPAYSPGTPQYYDRQNKISGRAEEVRPESYLTPAGIVNGIAQTATDIKDGNYGNLLIDAALTALPYGIGTFAKKIRKPKAGILSNGNYSLTVPSDVFTNKEKYHHKKSPQVVAEQNRRAANMSQYEKDVSHIYNTALDDPYGGNYIKELDKTFNTNYFKTFHNMFYLDVTNRGKYIKFDRKANPRIKEDPRLIGIESEMSGPGFRTNIYGRSGPKEAFVDGLNKYPGAKITPMDMEVGVNPSYNHKVGLMRHELGHIADYVETNGKLDNAYLRWLADPTNIKTKQEIFDEGIARKANGEVIKGGANYNQSIYSNYDYHTKPTEIKSHMLELKEILKNQGVIKDFYQPVNVKAFQEALKNIPHENRGILNHMKVFKNIDEYINKFNKIIPISGIGAAALGSTQKETK